MFLLIIYSTGCILDFLGHIDFIVYFTFLWPISFTFYYYGLKRLLFLKLSEGIESEKLLKRYIVIKDTMKTFYLCDILVILLYIFLIWDKRI